MVSVANKATANSSKKPKKASSAVGAPSQRTQASRKGKKAWRKNVNLDEVEEALEEIRVEERVVGTSVHSKTNDQLFQIDVKGDQKIRRTLPKFSTSALTSAKILAQRSAVPAVHSRATSSSDLKRKKVSHEDKDRLLRMGKRMRKGPFNGVMDPTEFGAGSALLEVSEAVKASGSYDVWAGEESQHSDQEEFIAPPPKVKAPSLPNIRSFIAVSAVPSPHEGASYNPPVVAHQDLLREAHEKEEKRIKEAEEAMKVKQQMEQARRVAVEGEIEGFASGMVVQEVTEDVEESGEEHEVLPVKKASVRKTKKERLKAAKLRAEKRALAEKLAQKHLHSAVSMAKSLRKSTAKEAAARERQKIEQFKRAEEEKLKKGLAGLRLGKHIVPEGEVDVQLSEDLTESLRGLKPEGNLFRDRFLSMQHRALIEPRTPVLPTKRKTKLKEYEKHAFKRFDREN